MNIIHKIDQLNVIMESLSIAILHSLWQGILLALVLGIALKLLRERSSNLRYLASTATLFAFALTFAATFAWVHFNGQKEEASSPITAFDAQQIDALEAVQVPYRPTLSENLLLLYQDFMWQVKAFADEIFIIWLVGVGIFSLRFISGLYYIQNLKKKQHRPVPILWESKLKELAGTMGIRQSVKLIGSPLVSVPTMVGWLRPIILMPISMMTQMTVGELEGVLAHELAHVKRHDYLVNLVQSVVEIILFFNPAAWWISACVNEERENCCDDLALQVTGNTHGYVKALASIAHAYHKSPELVMSVVGKKGSLLHRIRRIVSAGQPNMQPTEAMSGKMIGRFAAAMLVLSSLVVFTIGSGFQIKQRVEVDDQPALEDDIHLQGLEERFDLFPVDDTTKKKLRVFRSISDTVTVELVEVVEDSNFNWVEGDSIQFTIKESQLENGKTTMVNVQSQSLPDTIFVVEVKEAQKRFLFEIDTPDVQVKEMGTNDSVKWSGKAQSIKIELKDTTQGNFVFVRSQEDKSPLYIIDGVKLPNNKGETTMKQLKLTPEKIKSVEVLKGKTAVERYGAEGAEGAIIVITKEKNSIDEEKLAELAKDTIPKIAVKEVAPPPPSPKKPLFVVDGEIREKPASLQDIDPNDIEKINVLKGKSAMEKYGKEGKDGVVEIFTKSGKKKKVEEEVNEEVVFINPETNPTPKVGYRAYYDYLLTNTQNASANGKVYVQVTVLADGELSDIKVVRGIDPVTDAMAVQLIKNGHAWNPGTQNGKPVKSRVVMPVRFTPKTADQTADENPSNLFTNSLTVYPNPSESEAHIGFQLEKTERVKVSIYSLKGQMIAEVADRNFPAGIHQVTWDASRAKNGMYVVQVKRAGETITQKLLIEK